MQEFSNENDIDNEEEFVEVHENVCLDSTNNKLDARRRLESLLEEKRLQAEIDDFMDY
tara:strand:+ start:657 stop:830 length:174 start_codon:yes stop_codon:yes gene_type:complete